MLVRMSTGVMPAGPGVSGTADREVFDVPDKTGRDMVEGGYAVEVAVEAAPAEVVEPEVVKRKRGRPASKGKA